MANEIIEKIDNNTIKSKIYTIRGMQVMVDSDLAMLYEVETKYLNRQKSRNIDRFPEDFCFQLTKEEYNILRCQNVTSKKDEGSGGRRYMPYVFTESGIAMLASVLKSKVATIVSVNIMRVFVEMRRFLASNGEIYTRLSTIENKQLETDKKFDEVFDYIAETKEVSQKIFFDGQIYDAFSLLSEIVSKAKISIILIDGYVDYKTLDILCKKQDEVVAIIYTHSDTKLCKTDINKFNKQYGGLSVRTTSKFHDRFMILDKNKGYHIGASLKDAGNTSFAISKLLDNSVIRDLLDKL